MRITKQDIDPSNRFKPYKLILEIPDQTTAYRLYNALDSAINKDRSRINSVEKDLLIEIRNSINLQNGGH